MIHNERTLELKATPEQVWAVLGRYMHIHEFSPGVKSVDALTDDNGGMGSTRRCHFNDGTSVARVFRIQHDKSSIVHPTIRIFKTV